LFFCAVMLSAWRGGLGAGLLASLLSSAVFVLWLSPPLVIGNDLRSEAPRFLMLLSVSVFICWLCSQQKRTQAALQLARDELEQRVNERTKELAASEAKLKEAQRLANMGYWERDLVADRITWSEETCRIFGLTTPSYTLNQTKLQEMIHPNDRQIQRQALTETVQLGRCHDVEYRIVRSDGDVRFIQIRDEIKTDQLGRAVRAFGTVQDITERKRAEALLHTQQQEIRAIVENTPDWIVRFDTTLRRTYVNPAFVRAIGIAKEVLLGSEPGSAADAGARIVKSEDLEFFRKALERVLDTGQPLNVENTWTLPTGRRYFTARLEPEFDTHGALTSILTIARDVTELKRHEEQLRQTQAELARVARVTILGELTASIAHEVNQPLMGVVTNANAATRWLAAVPPDLEEARLAVGRIARDGNRASEVIKRIRALMNKGEAVKVPIDLNELIQETITLTEPEVNHDRVTLRAELSPALPRVTADRVQLQQVILNLIMNALDSLSAVADRARVLHICSDHSQPDAVRVAVEDTGGGIAPQDTERIFEPFYTTKPHGLGMGLAISRSIVEAHGGRLWATPNNGAGVTFQFALPIQNGGVS
ncbi:MAG TPA: ATP-binding protein, partial [Candidatus Acidoferrales bacterium]|nr:ATP-binding protein [Candidatus Acidoferrales bacterium]